MSCEGHLDGSNKSCHQEKRANGPNALYWSRGSRPWEDPHLFVSWNRPSPLDPFTRLRLGFVAPRAATSFAASDTKPSGKRPGRRRKRKGAWTILNRRSPIDGWPKGLLRFRPILPRRPCAKTRPEGRCRAQNSRSAAITPMTTTPAPTLAHKASRRSIKARAHSP
jgi:hypothetical protein